MKNLIGSEKQIAWAEKIRLKFLEKIDSSIKTIEEEISKNKKYKLKPNKTSKQLADLDEEINELGIIASKHEAIKNKILNSNDAKAFINSETTGIIMRYHVYDIMPSSDERHFMKHFAE